MEKLIEVLAGFIILLISKLGYWGIVLAMAIESASIPLPSEVIMPFSGYLVYKGEFNLWLVALAGAFGCLIGSLLMWWIGKRYGEKFLRNLIRRYGKYVLVFEYEVDDAIKLFKKHGEAIIFFSRLLPVVRTFISLPAGIVEMDEKKFVIYTFVGSFLWSFVLAWLGLQLGERWGAMSSWFHRFDAFIIVAFIILLIFYVYHKLSKHKKYMRKKDSQ